MRNDAFVKTPLFQFVRYAMMHKGGCPQMQFPNPALRPGSSTFVLWVSAGGIAAVYECAVSFIRIGLSGI